MENPTVIGILTDQHTLYISQRLTNYGNLRSLAYRGLKLDHHEIERAIVNSKSDVQAAAHDVLRTWFKNQNNKEEAFNSLHKALQESQLQMLADELVQRNKNKEKAGQSFGGLSESHVEKLSEMSDSGELRTLAYRGLKLDHDKIEPAISSKPDSKSAACEILINWLKLQDNEEKAFSALHEALTECQMQVLAEELEKLTMIVEEESETLTDVHIEQLSQRLTNAGELRTLAYTGLKLKHYEIEQAITNKPNDIQSASTIYFTSGSDNRKIEKEAYATLQSALQECKWSCLPQKLWAIGTISRKRKYNR